MLDYGALRKYFYFGVFDYERSCSSTSRYPLSL